MRITDTMQAFITNESLGFKDECAVALASQWGTSNPGALAPTFALLWSAYAESWTGSTDELIDHLIGAGATFDSCRLERWKVAVGTGGGVARLFRNSTLIECDFSTLNLRESSFAKAWIESVDFSNADLSSVSFAEANLLDVDVTGANLTGADFRSADSGLYLINDSAEYTGNRALGLLSHRGALVEDVDPLFIAMAHPHYEIARKIARRMVEGGASQLLGLTQRGASMKDPAAASRFVELLVSVGYASYDRSGAARTVETKLAGRLPLRQLAEETSLDPALGGFFFPTSR